MANFVSPFEKWGRRRCRFRLSWHYCERTLLHGYMFIVYRKLESEVLNTQPFIQSFSILIVEQLQCPKIWVVPVVIQGHTKGRGFAVITAKNWKGSMAPWPLWFRRPCNMLFFITVFCRCLPWFVALFYYCQKLEGTNGPPGTSCSDDPAMLCCFS